MAQAWEEAASGMERIQKADAALSAAQEALDAGLSAPNYFVPPLNKLVCSPFEQTSVFPL